MAVSERPPPKDYIPNPLPTHAQRRVKIQMKIVMIGGMTSERPNRDVLSRTCEPNSSSPTFWTGSFSFAILRPAFRT
jgi:hypothetical protein